MNTDLIHSSSIPMSGGSLVIFTGPMFSGKTTALLRELSLEADVGRKVIYINSCLDNRAGVFSTHNPLYRDTLGSCNIACAQVQELSDPELDIQDFDVIGVDEAQFFPDLEQAVKKFVEVYGKRVIVSGLSSDFRRKKFGQILDLEPIADSYIKLKSFCRRCAPGHRKDAVFSHLMVGAGINPDINASSDPVEVGGSNKYMALCRECYLDLTEGQGRNKYY